MTPDQERIRKWILSHWPVDVPTAGQEPEYVSSMWATDAAGGQVRLMVSFGADGVVRWEVQDAVEDTVEEPVPDPVQDVEEAVNE
jgi:hypothetical protein